MELDMLQGKTSPELHRAWARVATQFGRLDTLARKEAFAVGIVVLPCREQVTGHYSNARYQNTIRSLAEPLGFHVIDPLPIMRESAGSQELFIPYDRNHPSVEGHGRIARAIAEYLRQHGLIPATPAPADRASVPPRTAG
jgi:lysophospholipase L1-like esterase